MPTNETRRKVFLGVAWPYSNGSLHIGQIAGAYLPPDIFARYHRAAGNEVLMVSGSDQHGTPITVRAEQEGSTAAAVAARFHTEFLESWQRLGITFDLYTTTGTENHVRVVQDIFLKLHQRGDIYEGSMELPYCAVATLPPRPLRRGHLPDLRRRERPRIPVRQLRQYTRPHRPQESPLQVRRLRARDP